MNLDRSSQIIRSRSSLLGLFKAGAPSKWYSTISVAYLTYIFRCLATPEQLEEGIGDPRCQEHTEFLMRNFDSEMVWTAWGVDTMVQVAILLSTEMT